MKNFAGPVNTITYPLHFTSFRACRGISPFRHTRTTGTAIRVLTEIFGVRRLVGALLYVVSVSRLSKGKAVTSHRTPNESPADQALRHKPCALPACPPPLVWCSLKQIMRETLILLCLISLSC